MSLLLVLFYFIGIPGADTLVRGWSDGQIGIELGEGAAVSLPGLATSFHLEGDLQPIARHAASSYDGYGNDLLEGGAGFDFLIGGTGNDQLFGEPQIDDLATYILAAETQAGTGEVGDWLSGWDGSDILVGDKGEDLMIAGTGNDNEWRLAA